MIIDSRLGMFVAKQEIIDECVVPQQVFQKSWLLILPDGG
jgi:hypothetical protein